jgi:hypothetical protein
MAQHTARSLFDLNVVGADECLALHDGLTKIKVAADVTWLLRASVVFSVSALDAYFHDKVRYHVGKYNASNMPPALERVAISLGDLQVWESHKRKGNAIRNFVVGQLSFKSLQGKEQIADAMRLCGVDGFWSKLYPDAQKRKAVQDALKDFGDRRNDIVHEGDRLSARNSGKRLRPIDVAYARECRDFVARLVSNVESECPW